MGGSDDPLVGTQLGPIQVLERIGSGGMGCVYRAVHPEHGEVCIKVISPEHECHGEMLRRFRREAEAARRIDHPNVVRAYGLEEHAGHQVLVQELVRGEDLEALLSRHRGQSPLALAEAVRIGHEVVLGLGAAHAAGLVHRDLKPGNVLLARSGRGAPPTAKLCDLGLVLQVDGDPLDGQTILTRKGRLLGTPFYMAPEQWRGSHEVDARADLYAVGVLIHELVSGKLPLSANGLHALMLAHLREKPTPLRQDAPHAPATLEKIVARLLAKDPAERQRKASEVADELQRVLERLGNRTTIHDGKPSAARSKHRTGPKRTGPKPTDGAAGLGPMPTDAEAETRPDPDSERATRADATPGPVRTGARARAATPPPASEPSLGSVIADKLVLEAVLGRGGMGIVYKARHRLLDRHFAVKLIQASLARDPAFRERFLREADALLSFTDEAAVTLRDFGEHEDTLYMALDFAPGETLDVVLWQGPISERRALGIARQVLPCLQKAHEAGLVHRDLKPENLIIERLEDGSDRVRILDFGIAKIMDRDRVASDVTGTGVSVGTPHYMSPEQSAGDPVDGRADLYSFGCVLYEALAGRRPLDARTERKLIYKIQFEDPVPLADAAGGRVSDAFSAAVMRALAKEPSARPASARDLLEELEAPGGAGRRVPAAVPRAEPTRRTRPASRARPDRPAATRPDVGRTTPPLPPRAAVESGRDLGRQSQAEARAARRKAEEAEGADGTLLIGTTIVGALALALAIYVMSGGRGTDAGTSADAVGVEPIARRDPEPEPEPVARPVEEPEPRSAMLRWQLGPGEVLTYRTHSERSVSSGAERRVREIIKKRERMVVDRLGADGEAEIEWETDSLWVFREDKDGELLWDSATGAPWPSHPELLDDAAFFDLGVRYRQSPRGEVRGVDEAAIAAKLVERGMDAREAALLARERFQAGFTLPSREMMIGDTFERAQVSTEDVGTVTTRFIYSLDAVEERGGERIAVFGIRAQYRIDPTDRHPVTDAGGWAVSPTSNGIGSMVFSATRGRVLSMGVRETVWLTRVGIENAGAEPGVRIIRESRTELVE